MRWSKVRQIVESRLAPGLRARVRLESTHYRRADDQEGRTAIVIDSVQVWAMGCIAGDRERSEVFDELATRQPTACARNELASQVVRMNGQHNQFEFYRAVWDYVQCSIEDSLRSWDPLTRSLAYMDARVGKRRLVKLAAADLATDVERACLAARLEVEGLYDKRDALTIARVAAPGALVFNRTVTLRDT
jgi:hypothetical protein